MKRQREENASDQEEDGMDKSFKCPVCFTQFAKLQYLNQQMQKHKPGNACSKCGDIFSFRSSLKRHEKNVHHINSSESSREINSQRPLFTCNICGKSYNRKYHLDRHVANVHPQITRNSFTCRHCGMDFNNYRNLIEHVEREHPLNQGGGRQSIKSKSLDGESSNQTPNENSRSVETTNKSTEESALQNSVQNRNIFPRQNERYDVLVFFANVRNETVTHLRSRLRRLGGIKWNLCIQVEMQRDNENELSTSSPYFRSRTYTALSEIEDHDLNEAFQKMFASLEKYLRDGSGWFVSKVIKLEIHTVKYKPIFGSTYIPLPNTISKSNSVLNVRNEDEKCFAYSILAALHPQANSPDIADHYYRFLNELNMNGIAYPVMLPDIRKFENQNEDISINVFTFDDGSILPIQVTHHTNRTYHVNLLWLKNDETSHYCLITDLNRFLSRTKKHRNKSYFCPYCLHAFIREDLLLDHQPFCSPHGPQKVILPSNQKEAVLKFKDYQKTLNVPFVIYADFETINVPLQTCMPNPNYPSTTPTKKLEVCGFGYKVVCEDDRYSKPSVVYRGPDADKKLIESLLKEQERIQEILSFKEPIPDHEGLIENASECCLCKKKFTPNDRAYKKIVAHHNHLTGDIIGAACNACNLNCKQANFTCVIFHNLKNFDSHIICECLGKFKDHKLTCIPQNAERYVSFSLGSLRFIDSFQFLPSSLETLVENLKQDGVSAFPHLLSEFTNPEQIEMLLGKGVYPYEYMDSFERFEEQTLPTIDQFYSTIKRECITEEDYSRAQRIFREFRMTSLGDYHDLYLKTDVLLLSDVFESFRKVCLTQYELDPCHFYTSPGLSWAALLKMTRVELELLTDIDQILMVEAGIRGGVSQISNRHKKANNPYLDDYNALEPTSYLTYLDANNLYGWAMIQPLPVGSFRFVEDLSDFDVMTIPEDGEKGYILEVSLHYPSRLHDHHNCLPLAPEQKVITSEELSPYAQKLLRNLHNLKENDPLPSRGHIGKLLTTFADKDHYVLHYRNLQLYVQLGMEIKTIHRILQFRQEAWMRPYIEFNTEKRKNATSTFEKGLYKLFNVSTFGKTMENVRKHKNIELTHREERLLKLSAKPTYKTSTIFNEDLVAVELLQSKVKLFKPSYCGMCILDLSKLLMYDFWYNFIKKHYGNRAELQMTDTDSLLVYYETEDIYDDMLLSIDMFDTSDYPTDHPLHNTRNKKVLGKMKDETNGVPISEFVGLRSKMYSYTCNGKEEKRAKGISKISVKKDLKHEHYKNTLFQETKTISTMTSLRSNRHKLFSEILRKTGLSAFDDKRYLLNSVESYAYSHYKIKENDATEASIELVEEPLLQTNENAQFEINTEQSFMVGDFKVTPCINDNQ